MLSKHALSIGTGFILSPHMVLAEHHGLSSQNAAARADILILARLFGFDDLSAPVQIEKSSKHSWRRAVLAKAASRRRCSNVPVLPSPGNR